MRLIVYVKDEGITDDTYKDGDIFQIHEDSWEPGEKEKQPQIPIIDRNIKVFTNIQLLSI